MKHPVLWFFRIACAAFLGFNIYLEHSGKFIITPREKLVLAAVFIFLAFMSFAEKKPKIKLFTLILFLYYVWVLANILFFDVGFGRDNAFVGVNLTPFHTIQNYLKAHELGNISTELAYLNLIGNLAAFAPMAIFLPILFKPQNNILVFFLTIVLLVGSVEGIQYVTQTGSCDIDDLILNTVGAMILWIIMLPFRLIAAFRRKKNE